MRVLLLTTASVLVLGACGGGTAAHQLSSESQAHQLSPDPSPTSTVFPGDPGLQEQDTGTPDPATAQNFLTEPVDGSSEIDQNVTMKDGNYQHSVIASCPTTDVLDWDTSGHNSFTAVVGIPDTATNALGKTIKVALYDQDNHKLTAGEATLGKPVVLALQRKLSGVIRLRVSCTITPADSPDVSFALGDANFYNVP